MTQPYKICPNCGQTAPPGAVYCSNCGTLLADSRASRSRTGRAAGGYDLRYGETDLMEGDVRTSRLLSVAALLSLGLIAVCAGIVIAVAVVAGSDGAAATQAALTSMPTPANANIGFVTNTPRPTLDLPTVTPAPPSPTPTETPGPCVAVVQAGDGLIGLASRCGHQSLDVIPVILELNGLSAAENIQVGQQILIPWPTPTIDPSAPTPTPVGGSISSRSGVDLVLAESVDASVAALPTEPPTPTAVPTDSLPPGVAWHIVQPNENMISIAFMYNTNAETLAQLNPEIAFSQCDFSLDTGGPRCTVLLGQGQRVRVPAPTPTPTLSPTLSGSETPTPTATPTFNAPNAISPPDRALFAVDDIITLRWITTGELGANDRYRVQVRDVTSGQDFSADTTDLLFIIPNSWQGTDGRLHEYEWSVSVIDERSPDTPIFTTTTRSFSWQGRVTQ